VTVIHHTKAPNRGAPAPGAEENSETAELPSPRLRLRFGLPTYDATVELKGKATRGMVAR